MVDRRGRSRCQLMIGSGLSVGFALEIEHQGPLVAVGGQEVGGVAVRGVRRTPLSRVVAARWLDLDDISAEIPEGHGDERTCQYPGKVGDTNTGKR
ncbi:hypothetical protein Z951_43800 [Streptomyces sp. PRh5]|nr:hypothetical protein Z951_43800 [Streptomyces sp. PRh5]